MPYPQNPNPNNTIISKTPKYDFPNPNPNKITTQKHHFHETLRLYNNTFLCDVLLLRE